MTKVKTGPLYALVKARSSFEKMLIHTFPEGIEVAWLHGQNMRTGVVVDVLAWADDLFIQTQSGKRVHKGSRAICSVGPRPPKGPKKAPV